MPNIKASIADLTQLRVGLQRTVLVGSVGLTGYLAALAFWSMVCAPPVRVAYNCAKAPASQQSVCTQHLNSTLNVLFVLVFVAALGHISSHLLLNRTDELLKAWEVPDTKRADAAQALHVTGYRLVYFTLSVWLLLVVAATRI